MLNAAKAAARRVEGRKSDVVLPGAPYNATRQQTVSMVAVAQLVRVLDCDSSCRGFESHQPPHLK